MAGFTLKSPSFAEGAAIPSRHTCDGADLSPALSWQDAPAGTVSLALIVDDPDAGGFVHWVAYDIPGSSSGTLSEGIPAAGQFQQGRNGFGKTGYGGPCPPSGTHHYHFTIYALSGTLGLPGTPSAADVRAALPGHVLAETTLTGTYQRGG